MGLLCFWMQTIYLAWVLSPPGFYTHVQMVSSSRHCRSCAERKGLCRARCLLWHTSPPLPGCCWMLLHAHSLALEFRDAKLLLLFNRNCLADKI